MSHPDLNRSVRVSPPLDGHEIDVLRSLAGVGVVRRIWPGQPGPRSPWLPCGGGCCLVAQHRPARDLTAWMRFLLRELLAPRAAASVRRAASLDLPGAHVLDGQVEVKAGAVSRLVVVRANRVTERAAVGRGQLTER
jgi:hypothetical protein